MKKVENAFIPFLEQPEEFADLFNGFVFGGRQVILPETLSPLSESERSVLKEKDGTLKTIVRFRDIVRKAKIGSVPVLLVCAVEHQENLDYSMPHRVMLYESLEYNDQITHIQNGHRKKKDLPQEYFIGKMLPKDRITPVITIVVYSGEKEWAGARCLYDMMDLEGIPEDAMSYIGNWPLNLISLNDPIDSSKYQSDLRLLFDLATRKQDEEAMEKYIRNHKEFKSLSTYTSYMLSQYLNISIEHEQYTNATKGGINMCKAIEDMKETARTKGLEQGRKLGLIQGRELGLEQGRELGLEQGRAEGEQHLLMQLVQSKYNKGKALAQIADECETTEENILSIMKEMNLAF